MTASAISVCFAPVLRPWNVKRTLFGDTFETLLKNVPQMEEMKYVPCRCLCDAHKKMSDVRCSENGQTDVLEESNYSDHSYSDALIVWQKCARHMYHHYLCQLLETLKVIDRSGSGRVSRVDNRLHEGVLKDILYLSLYIIAEEDHDGTITTPRPESDRSHGVSNGVSGKNSCSENADCRLNCTNVKYINEFCERHLDDGGGGGGRGRKKDASHVTSGSGSSSGKGKGSGSGCERTRSPSCLVIVRDIISDCLNPSHTANTAVLCAAYGCHKEALEACRQHLLMHSPQQQQQQRHQHVSNGWHGTRVVSEGETGMGVEAEAEAEAAMVHSHGVESYLQKGHLCDGRDGASRDVVPSVRTVLLRCLQIAVTRMVMHALSTRTQGGPDSRTSPSSFKPSLSPLIHSSAVTASRDAEERRRSDIGADITDDVILAIKLLWVLLAREMTTGREGDMEEEEAADRAVKAMIETIVSCMMSSPVCLCAPALEGTETASHTDTVHTTQHNDHVRDCLQAVWTPGGICIDPHIKTWTLDLLSRTPSPSAEPDPDSSFRCYTLNDLRGTVAMSLSKCVLTALGSHLTANFIQALPASFFDFLDLDFIAELVD